MNKNKLALISGATSGIGKASAELFAKEGWNLVITGRRQERLDVLAKKLSEENKINVITLCFDVANRSELQKAIAKHQSDLETIDVLINNAGLALGKSPFQDGLDSDWETMIDTNVKGLIYLTKEIIPFFLKKKSGHIINVSSTASRDMYPGGNVYSATKSAVDALTKSLRLDLLEHNIKVSSVAPGMVQTEFSEVRFHGDKAMAERVYEGFEPLKAKDIADAIYYIASRPAHVHIGDMVITCTAQANSNVVFKS
jgi:NADP-dependent 3-hydroxy acid dehydrogenase YdfG